MRCGTCGAEIACTMDSLPARTARRRMRFARACGLVAAVAAAYSGLVGLVLLVGGPGTVTGRLLTTIVGVLLSAASIAVLIVAGMEVQFLFAVTMIESDSKMPLSTTSFTSQQGYTQNLTLISAADFIMIAPC